MEASMSPLDILSKVALEQLHITLQGGNEQQSSSDCPVKEQSVTVTIPRASSTPVVKRQKLSHKNGEGSSKTREIQVEHPHCLTEEIRKCVSSTLKGILAGCDEKKFESLIEEITSFMLSLYSKGYFDIIKPENNTQKTHNPAIPGTSKSSTSPSSFNTSKNSRKFVHKRSVKSNDLVPIGDGHATVPERLLKHMNWSSHTACTRKLLTAVFPREVLATHSLTGKASPAFPNKPAKEKLDPLLVHDIIQTVMDKCGVTESQV
ncbi:unnamed protein product [Chilo suppressalis]|uniref:BEN domain-containing protein n=1 Tax=Chilo suppressalis TaxID=168631 RepID=A0ABN8B480_CHISP|nr:unnamed protein product [Chilo suppressalis]